MTTPVRVNGTCGSGDESPQPGKSGQVKLERKRKRANKGSSNSRAVRHKGGGEEFEVEYIEKHAFEAADPARKSYYQQVAYYIKWKDWDSKHNTWEDWENLKNSLETVVGYWENLLGQRVESASQYHAFKKTVLDQITDKKIEARLREFILPHKDNLPVIVEAELEEKTKLISRLPRAARAPKMVEELVESYLILEFTRRRNEQLVNLKEWEEEINRILTDKAPVKVINTVDLDCRPVDFKYINTCTFLNLNDSISLEAITGCDCTDCSKGRCECASRDRSRMGYNSSGLVQVPKGVAIYECTELCRCGPECSNRVLQKGRTIPLCIFKTNNGCGWGVKTLSNIPKGHFVTEYVGEVITTEESESRGNRYTREGRTYLFDLDFNGKDCKYTIDAAEYGNVSHFINHSCSPNLEVRAVYVNCIDAALPRLGLFSIRNIRANEEINFDYLCQPIEKKDKRGNIVIDPKVNCRCNSGNCRTYLF